MNTFLSFYQNLRYKQLGKFILFLFVGIVVFGVYYYWNDLMLQIVELQKTLHSMLSSHIAKVAHDSNQFGMSLIALSFGYGIFHAIGPGHGKGIIVTYLGTHKEGVKKGVAISVIAALLQSSVAIALISIFSRLLKFKFAEVQNIGSNIEKVSYIMAMCIGLLLLIKSLYKLYQLHQIRHEDHTHEHTSSCGCHHVSPPSPETTWTHSLIIILSMGLRPCSGALIVLTYAHLVGVYSYGIAATLMMGAGVGFSVSLIAIGSQYFRNRLERMVKDSTNSQHAPKLLLYMRSLGGILLFLIGWGLLKAASLINSAHPLL